MEKNTHKMLVKLTPGIPEIIGFLNGTRIKDIFKVQTLIVKFLSCAFAVGCGMPVGYEGPMIHLGSLALSGAGLLCLEATAVEADGRISPDDLGLYNDATEAALKRVLTAIRRYSDIKFAVQLAHAGRKASTAAPWEGNGQVGKDKRGWVPYAPSPLAYSDKDVTPHALDAAGLARVREAFVASARRADRLGIEAIEIHGAHGYLLHQFLSPLSNQRTDNYGGSLENRMRFPLEVFDAVRAAFPKDKPVGIRLSATDWVEGGWDVESTIALSAELKKRGVDWVDVSSAGLSAAQKITVGPGYQVAFAEAVKKATVLLEVPQYLLCLLWFVDFDWIGGNVPPRSRHPRYRLQWGHFGRLRSGQGTRARQGA